VKPIIASSSDEAQASQPAAIILGPATPKHFRSGTCARSAVISAAPRVSPEDSPATMPMLRGPPAVRPREASLADSLIARCYGSSC
jgi:hypothetical protein